MTLALRQCGAPTRRGTPCRNPPSGSSGRCHSHILPARALTASVAKVDMDAVGWKEWKAGGREWQREAWRLYDITGPLRFVANWMGSSVSRCVLYVAEVDESGEPGDRATKPQVAALAAGPLGTGPAKDENLRLLAINNFVAGEAWTVAEAGADEVRGDDGKTTKGDRWFVVSSRQVKRSGDTVVIRRPRLYGGGDMTFRPGEDIILQVWTPHPDNTDEPDSPARSAIPVLRAIEVIWKRIFAELDSRLTGAGVLVMSQNMDFPRGDDAPVGVEGFAQLLMRTMATSMQDRSSAAAVAPIVMTAPPDEIDKLKHLTFWSELSDQLLPLLEAAVRYLAQSLDVPAEILTGMAAASHWTGWQIEEGTVKTQIVPILNRIADALTTGYLKPALEDLGEDPEKYCYAFDTGPLTARPDRSADALSYQQAGIINTDAAIELGALREDQKLEGEERLKWLAEKLVLASPQLVADPVLRELVGFPPAPQAAAQQSSPPPDGGGVAAGPVEQPEPEKPEDSPPERPTVADEQQGEEPVPENPPGRAVKEPKPGRKAKATTAAAGWPAPAGSTPTTFHLPGEHRQADHAPFKHGAEALDAAPVRTVSQGGVVRFIHPTNEDFNFEPEADTLLSYSTHSYEPINTYLRTGTPTGGVSADRVEEWVRDIDSVMEQSPLEHPVVVYRGVPDPHVALGDVWSDGDMTGVSWVDKAYSSTSAEEETPRSVARGDVTGGGILTGAPRSAQAAVMRVRVPAGTGGVGLGRPGRGERELLLQRGLSYRVVVDHGLVDGVRRLDVEVRPAAAGVTAGRAAVDAGVAALVPVAALATVRALSLAGGRLVPRTRRDEWPDTPRHLLHTHVGPVDVERAGWALRGAWDDLPAVAAELSVDPDGLRDVLHGHVVGLLTAGSGYDPGGLRDVLLAMPVGGGS